MKYLIYELFSGVGLCNQIFSLETAIYLASIMKRKLILIIKYPLCHCGKTNLGYGHLLNFFTDDFKNYLPNGIDVFYKSIPNDIQTIISNPENYYNVGNFSGLVFVDEELDTPENENDIQEFCHFRKKHVINYNNITRTYIYINKSNASRCFYNFYTTNNNYKLMYNICTSLKFKPILHEIASKLYRKLPRQENDLFIFFHLRFGDYFKKAEFLERNNDIIIKNFKQFVENHITDSTKPTIYLLIDNKNNEKFNDSIKTYDVKYIDSITQNIFENYLSENNMVLHDFDNVTNYDVINAIIEIIMASKADEFVGYSSSTFSHYIQYLRFVENKSFFNYINIKNCRLEQVEQSSIEWKRLGFIGGHPVSWQYFFKPLKI